MSQCSNYWARNFKPAETRNQNGRKFCFEALEPRQMLSATAGGLPALLSPSQPAPDLVAAIISTAVDNHLGARDQALAISAVHLRVDGREATLTSLDQPLSMEIGSSLQIVGIDYRLQGDGAGESFVSGKIAFEAYLNKLHGSRLLTDYGDGRFGGHVQDGQLPLGSASHPGLQGDWEMAAGTESITLVMVRYGPDEVLVEDRITILTQVGTPDFVIHPEITIKGSSQGLFSGKRVKIEGAWGNVGEGTYRNYAEVDITHESDPTKIVWVGTLADVVEGGDDSGQNWDKGQFQNKFGRDGFSKSWIPELGGTYTLKLTADPESRWAESNENNNSVIVEVEVRDLRQSAGVKDATKGFGFNHHYVVETLAHDAVLAAAASQLSAGPVNTLPAQAMFTETTPTDITPAEGPRLRGATDRADLDAIDTRLASVSTAQAAAVVETIGRNIKTSFQDRDAGEWTKAIDSALAVSLRDAS